MKKLKKCPFCGNKVGWYRNNMNCIVGLQCKNRSKCGATFIFFKNGINIYSGDKEKITEMFNKRAEVLK